MEGYTGFMEELISIKLSVLPKATYRLPIGSYHSCLYLEPSPYQTIAPPASPSLPWICMPNTESFHTLVWHIHPSLLPLGIAPIYLYFLYLSHGWCYMGLCDYLINIFLSC